MSSNKRFVNPAKVGDEHYTTYTTADRVLSLFPPEFFAGKMIDCCCDGWFDGENGEHGLNEVTYYKKQGQQDVWNHDVKHRSEIVNWLRKQIEDNVIHPASITLSGYSGPQGKEQDALLAPQYGMSWQQLNFRKYDLIITNPPFSDNQGIQLLQKCVKHKKDFILWNHHRYVTDIDFLRLLAAGKVYLAVGQATMEFQSPKGFRQVICSIYTSRPVWQGKADENGQLPPQGQTLFSRQCVAELLNVYYPDELGFDYPLRYHRRNYCKKAPTLVPVKNVQWVDKAYPIGIRLPLYGSQSVPFKSGIYLVRSGFLHGYLYPNANATQPMNYRILGVMGTNFIIEVI